MRKLTAPQLVLKLAAAATLVLCVTACEEEIPAPNRPTAPSAQTGTPTTDPGTVATTQPVVLPATVVIGDRPIEFPPAVLVLRSNGTSTIAMLYTDDPKEMLDGGYRGNSFYFKADLGDVSIDDILSGGAPDTPVGQRLTTPFTFIVDESRRTGTPNGLFLDGSAFVLQPKDAEFVIDPNGAQVSIEVRGVFQKFAGDEAFSGERVIVRATLIPEVVRE